MLVKPPGEIVFTAGTLPPAPTTPPGLIVGGFIDVTRNSTPGRPVKVAETTTVPGLSPRVNDVLARPLPSVRTLDVLNRALPEVTKKPTGVPAIGTPPRNTTWTTSGLLRRDPVNPIWA